jgi:glutathione synthase/RimK-type ligase-like ATP-grasp enzyme
MKRRVLLVGNDEHAAFVSSAVERAGGVVVALDPLRLPHLSLREDGAVDVDGDVASAVYIKSLPSASPLPSAAEIEASAFDDWRDRMTAARETHSLLLSALGAAALAGVPVVNTVESIALHIEKPRQMALLAKAQVPVPATLATNDPSAVRAFAAAHAHASVIYKPLSGGAQARLLVSDDLADDRLALLAHCPVLLQERVMGEERRVYVLAGTALAAFAVPTAGAVDARENLAHVTRCSLTPELAAVAVRASAACGTVFSAVDLRLTASGPVVLEVNPTPAIAFHDPDPNGDVVTALARFLVTAAAAR